MAENSNITDLIRALEAEYDLDSGFLGQLRQGNFESIGLERLVALLRSITISNEPTINRRLVSLLWMIPTFMGWQERRVAENGGDTVQLQHGIDKVQEILNSLLGTP